MTPKVVAGGRLSEGQGTTLSDIHTTESPILVYYNNC